MQAERYNQVAINHIRDTLPDNKVAVGQAFLIEQQVKSLQARRSRQPNTFDLYSGVHILDRQATPGNIHRMAFQSFPKVRRKVVMLNRDRRRDRLISLPCWIRDQSNRPADLELIDLIYPVGD